MLRHTGDLYDVLAFCFCSFSLLVKFYFKCISKSPFNVCQVLNKLHAEEIPERKHLTLKIVEVRYEVQNMLNHLPVVNQRLVAHKFLEFSMFYLLFNH